MPRVNASVGQFLADESGISSVEYALLLTFIGGAIFFAVETLSAAVINKMETTADCIDGTTNAANC